MSESQADVIVVGAGIAGTSTALAAVEAGLSVILVEKMPEIGGSSVMSGGFFAFTETNEQAAMGESDSEALFRSDLVAIGGGAADEALIDVYLSNQSDTYAWLKGHGVVFDDVELSSGQSAARSHHTDIKALVPHLVSIFKQRGGLLRLASPVVELLHDDERRVSGVKLDSGEELSAAVGVVLASGGFTRARDLLQTFAPDQLNAIPYGGPGNTGDGLRLAWALGAGVADMGYISATYGSHPDTGPEFHELLTAYYLGAIIVNRDGLRFVDESQSYKVLGHEVLKMPGGLGFQVFDSVVRAKSRPGIPLVDIDMLEDIGHVYRAESLSELSRMAGIDESGLLDTVERYNDAIAGGRSDAMGRTALCNGVGELLPIVAPPFYAYEAKALMTSTFAGVTVSPAFEVMTVDRRVISGLYAVGELIGGFHGRAYMTGTSLGKGAVFGRVVAQELAAERGA
jgi:fumarate reductase flavoprotein subunit